MDLKVSPAADPRSTAKLGRKLRQSIGDGSTTAGSWSKVGSSTAYSSTWRSPPLSPTGSWAKSTSLPSLSQAGSRTLGGTSPRQSPYAARQLLYNVEVRHRRLVREVVGRGGSRVLSRKRLNFVSFERGLEWDQQRPPTVGLASMAVLPKALPPLREVVGSAVKELGLDFPPKPESLGPRTERAYFGRRRQKRGGRRHASKQKRYRSKSSGPMLEPTEFQQLQEAVIRREISSPLLQSRRSRSRTSTLTGGMSTAERPVTADRSLTEEVDSSWEEELPWSEDELHYVFQKFGADRDHQVDIDDLPAILRYLGSRPTTEEVQTIIKGQTPYSSLEFGEFLEFIYRYRQHDIENLRRVFKEADTDASGSLEFKEVEAALRRLGYSSTVQVCLEALEQVDKDGDGSLDFREFEALREYLRQTEGFMQADVQELRSLYERAAGGKARRLQTEEIWRITMFVGYPVTQKDIAQIVPEVDAEGSGTVSFPELLKIIRRVRDDEREAMVQTLKKFGDDEGSYIPVADLGIALCDLGYFVSEDAVFEMLDSIGETEDFESLTLDEFAAFLRAYKRCEGFSQAEVEELTEGFEREDDQGTGSIGPLQLGRVLRSFGFPRTLQRVHRLVEEIDFDGSGFVEINEYIKLMRQLLQGEAKKRRQIFQDLDDDENGSLRGTIPVGLFADAVEIMDEVEPDPNTIALVNSMVLSPGTKSCTHSEFEAWCKQYRRLVVEEMRKHSGYSPKEVQQLRSIFEQYDKDKGGTLEQGELRQLISQYFPDATKSRAQQQAIEKLLSSLDTTNKEGCLDFPKFLSLMRMCDDMRDEADIKLEGEVVKECCLKPDDVEGFRQIFMQNVEWTGELDLITLLKILRGVVRITDDFVEDLGDILRELHPHGREVARFPIFLKLMSRLTQDNAFHINEAASKVVERDKQRKTRQMKDIFSS